MLSPLTTTLIKIFAKGFYKAHAGLLLFFFVLFLMYGFFMEVLNQTHLTQDEITYYHLILVLTFISSPAMTIFVFAIWLFFTVKSWRYVTSQIAVPGNQFLLYSSTSVNRIAQFNSWFIVQLVISLPLVLYGLFSLVIGIFFGYYILPIIIALYVLLLAAISALLYVRHINTPIHAHRKSMVLRMTMGWGKPFFSLFLYHAFDTLKVALAITKLLSYGMIAGSVYLLADVRNPLRVAGMVAIGIAVTHAVLIYRSYQFENIYLSFSRNFPYSRIKLYGNGLLTYWLLIFPESVWLLAKFGLTIGFALLILSLGTGMLFRSLLYSMALNMKGFIYWVFYLFVLLFLVIQFNLFWPLIPLPLLVSATLFYRNYYRQKFLRRA